MRPLRLALLLSLVAVAGCDSDGGTVTPDPEVETYTVSYTFSLIGSLEPGTLRYRKADGTVATITDPNLFPPTIDLVVPETMTGEFFIEVEGAFEFDGSVQVGAAVTRDDEVFDAESVRVLETEQARPVDIRAAVTLPALAVP